MRSNDISKGIKDKLYYYATHFHDESALKNALEDGLGMDADIKVDVDSWMNIPLMTGLQYVSQNPGSMNFYFIGQIGINFVMPPDLNITVDVYDSYLNQSFNIKSEQKNESTSSFTYAIGGGLLVNENIKVGIQYFGMGEPKIKAKAKAEVTYEDAYGVTQTEIETSDAEFKQELSILLITLSIAL